VYLRTLSPYLDSSFLIVILRIQLELICWATTPPVVITLLTLRITYTPSPLTGPTVVPTTRFRYSLSSLRAKNWPSPKIIVLLVYMPTILNRVPIVIIRKQGLNIEVVIKSFSLWCLL